MKRAKKISKRPVLMAIRPTPVIRTNGLKKKRTTTKLTTYSAPAAFGLGRKNTGPSMNYKSKGDGCTISHCELFTPVAGGTAAITGYNFPTGVNYTLNPGLSILFPYLSAQATRWEEYRFKRLRTIYEPICGTDTSGYLIQGFSHNVTDAVATTEPVVESLHNSTTTSLWRPCVTDWTPHEDASQWYKVRTGALPALGNYNDYDQMQFMGISNTNLVTAVGRLYFDYVIEFRGSEIIGSLVTAPALISECIRSVTNFTTSSTAFVSPFGPAATATYSLAGNNAGQQTTDPGSSSLIDCVLQLVTPNSALTPVPPLTGSGAIQALQPGIYEFILDLSGSTGDAFTNLSWNCPLTSSGKPTCYVSPSSSNFLHGENLAKLAFLLLFPQATSAVDVATTIANYAMEWGLQTNLGLVANSVAYFTSWFGPSRTLSGLTSQVPLNFGTFGLSGYLSYDIETGVTTLVNNLEDGTIQRKTTLSGIPKRYISDDYLRYARDFHIQNSLEESKDEKLVITKGSLRQYIQDLLLEDDCGFEDLDDCSTSSSSLRQGLRLYRDKIPRPRFTGTPGVTLNGIPR